MPDIVEPSDLIDPEAPVAGGAKVDTAAYASAPEARPSSDNLASGVRSPAEAPVATTRGEPPPPPPPSVGGGDPHAGEHGEAPPRVGLQPGGGEGAPVGSPTPEGEGVLDAAADALLSLAADRRWDEISLRDVAGRAGVSFAALYALAPGKAALLSRLGDRYDRQALRAVDGDGPSQAHDRLFEAFMARLEAMAPHRDALIAIGRAQPLRVAAGLGRTARALAEGAGVDTSGARGAVRLAALTPAWARTLQVWRDDEGALNRTMAEIDRLLRRASKRLARVASGF